MLLKDKTASSIKRKVQLAKQQVDKGATEARKVLEFAEIEVDDTYEAVQVLTLELEGAHEAEEVAKSDLLLANKVSRVAVKKRSEVLSLIDRFEVDLDILLNDGE